MPDPQDDPADELRIERYVALAKARPDAFSNPDPNGIVILLEKNEIRQAEAILRPRFHSSGHPPDWACAGIFYEDPWLYVVRDIVRFPDGSLGTYHHLVLKGGTDGVVILPVYDGKIVLVRHFRNGARDWSIEIPRGGPRSDVSPQDNALDELREEIGGVPERIFHIGRLRNNNGMLSESMIIYVAYLKEIGAANLGEGISNMRLVPAEEVRAMIMNGDIDDSHTAHAFFLAREKGLI